MFVLNVIINLVQFINKMMLIQYQVVVQAVNQEVVLKYQMKIEYMVIIKK